MLSSDGDQDLTKEEEDVIQELFQRMLTVSPKIKEPVNVLREQVNKLFLDGTRNMDTLSVAQKVWIREEFLNRAGRYFDECMK